MAIEDFDNGQLDDLFQTLCSRIEGKEIESGRAVLRSDIMQLFDAFITVAEDVQNKRHTPVRKSLEKVIQTFSNDRLLEHLRDVLKHQSE